MTTVYIDESYGDRVFVLVALLATEMQANVIRTELDSLMRRVSLRFGIAQDAEIHAYDIMRPRGPWLPLVSLTHARLHVLSECVDATVGSGARIIVARVGEDAVGGRVTHHLVDAYRLAVSGVADAVERPVRPTDGRVRIVADIVGDLDAHRRALANWRGGRVLPAIDFLDSRANRPTQAADMVAYLWRRVEEGGGSDRRTASAARGLVARIAQATVEVVDVRA